MTEEDAKALDLARAALLSGNTHRGAAKISGLSKELIAILIRFDMLPKSKNLPFKDTSIWSDELTKEVSQLILAGHTNQQIADATGISKRSVENFVTERPQFRGMRKIGRPKS